MSYYIYKVKKLVTSPKTSDWCRLPYPNHPKGCPKNCPQEEPALTHLFDLSQPLYLIHSEFNLLKHAWKLKQKYPHWSTRQCKCVLYWQNTSRKQLRLRVEKHLYRLNCNIYHTVPEALGVNVYATALKSGLTLQKIRNLVICKHVALVGSAQRTKIKL